MTAAAYGGRPRLGSVSVPPREKVSPLAGRTGTRTSTAVYGASAGAV